MSTNKNFSGFYAENKALLSEYLEIRLRLVKLQGIKALSRSLGMLFAILVVSSIGLFVILFLGTTFALWIAEKTGSNVTGFASGAGLFFVLLLIVIVFRKPLFLTPLIRLFIREMSNDLYESEHHEQDTQP
jgi:hypothetical protein